MKNGKIYIFCPGNIISGGVNSLLMLGRALRNNTFEAGMYFIDPRSEILSSAIVSSFGMPAFDRVDDDHDNIIVVPETMTFYLSQYRNVRKVVYWLSIQFFFKMPSHRFPFTIRLFRKLIAYNYFKHDPGGKIIYLKRRIQKWDKIKSGVWDNHITHLTNSVFISEFISYYGISNAIVLHNPVRDEFYNLKPLHDRENIILAGPKTSGSIIRLLRKRLGDHKTIRVRRMDSTELLEFYTKSKMFVEMGNTNRDRTIREAALSGCVVMVANSGGSANDFDTPVPGFYKIDTDSDYKADFLEKVKTICSDYSWHFAQQLRYRNFLADEKSDFDTKVNSVFTGIRNT